MRDPDSRREREFYDLDAFQAAIKKWAYANFGEPGDGRSIRLKNFFEAMVHCTDEGVDPKRLTALVDSVLEAPSDAPSYRPLLGMGEELGELMHAHLKGEQGIRHTPEEIRDKKLDAMGDLLVYAADYCNREHIRLSACIERAWGEVRQRDWKANAMTGRSDGN